jgi:hypothetical protein
MRISFNVAPDFFHDSVKQVQATVNIANYVDPVSVPRTEWKLWHGFARMFALRL